MYEILSDIGDALMQPADPGLCFLPVIREFLLASQPPLQLRQLPGVLWAARYARCCCRLRILAGYERNPCGPSCGSPESRLASGRSLYRLAPNLSKIAATLATGHPKATGARSSSLAAKRTCPHNRAAFLCFRSVACSTPRLGYRRSGTNRQSVAGCEVVRHSAGLRIGSLAPSARKYRSWSIARHQDTCHGHLVFITKYRHRVFDGAIKRLRGLFCELAQRRIQQNTPTEET